MREARLLSARTLTPSVRELTFDAGSDFSFVPGQWVSFKIPGDGEALPRSYSIATAPQVDGIFAVAVTRVEGGPGSTYLHGMEPGATLPMSDAQGFFTLTALERPVLMVATGTGVCPFRSMLWALQERGPLDHRAKLLLGVRTEQDILYGDEFARLADQDALFEFLPTLSRGGATWTERRGYVQNHIASLVHELGDCDVFVCGLSRMVKDVRRILKTELGVPKQRIHTERYD
jgi:ferredoxin-NADP reductase